MLQNDFLRFGHMKKDEEDDFFPQQYYVPYYSIIYISIYGNYQFLQVI